MTEYTSRVNLTVWQCYLQGTKGSISVPNCRGLPQTEVLQSVEIVEGRQTVMCDSWTLAQLQLKEGVPDISKVDEPLIAKVLAIGEVQTIQSLQTNCDSIIPRTQQ